MGIFNLAEIHINQIMLALKTACMRGLGTAHERTEQALTLICQKTARLNLNLTININWNPSINRNPNDSHKR